MCTYFGKLELNLNFSQYRSIILPFCSTLALIAIPGPTASGLHTGGHIRANRRVQFLYKGKKQNTSMSNQVHNYPFLKQFLISNKPALALALTWFKQGNLKREQAATNKCRACLLNWWRSLCGLYNRPFSGDPVINKSGKVHCHPVIKWSDIWMPSENRTGLKMVSKWQPFWMPNFWKQTCKVKILDVSVFESPVFGSSLYCSGFTRTHLKLSKSRFSVPRI